MSPEEPTWKMPRSLFHLLAQSFYLSLKSDRRLIIRGSSQLQTHNHPSFPLPIGTSLPTPVFHFELLLPPPRPTPTPRPRVRVSGINADPHEHNWRQH
ncbi:hypothetical protein G7K_2296-t1 [Saitoella complicata NRRL Y-17804]|uniref:Uncharacterized protein n=1 Tax=Saitoella complicata (strain BCRC 22490 / CBS 7301 / JCM 7358 / NBRC 10748 / NRRL Y-17804) TaxID=698492 RepID=A0A0E9NEJ0_SAICN|nr:hypothetical protein G7K_2296-t1 [Saitoella complicata NRRL Y-17804]